MAKNNRLKGEKALFDRNQKWNGQEEKLFAPVPKELEELIITSDLKQLREGLFAGMFTSVQLVNVFAKRCFIIGRDNCYSADERFGEAYDEAVRMDQEREEARKDGALDSLPVLHGIPISIKEIFDVKGLLLTVGCDFRSQWISTQDAPSVRMLKEAGAIILVKGNIPQLTFSYHSYNRIWGCSRNPFNPTRSCGGSTGGDSGLVATRCVPLALGSDLGGSIRIPCDFNGIYGFKATSQRMATSGNHGILKDNFNALMTADGRIRSAIGPVGKTLDDVITGMKILLNPRANHFDPYAPPCPFREELFNKASAGSMKVGYIESLPTLPASAPMRKAVKMAKEALEQQGYSMVEFQITSEELHAYNEVMTGLVGNFNVLPTLKTISNAYEEWIPQYGGMAAMLMGPFFLPPIIKFIFKITGNGRIAQMLHPIRPLKQEELESLMVKQIKLVKDMHERWAALGIDALIMPNYPIPAFKSANVDQLGSLRDYQLLWSILHYPAGVVPITTVDGTDTAYPDDCFNDMWTRAIRNDLATAEGMPVGVQVVARKWEDEIALGVMKAIDQQIRPNICPKLQLVGEA